MSKNGNGPVSNVESNKAMGSSSLDGKKSPPIAAFQLTQFESTLLQADLQRRLCFWTDRWTKIQDKELRTASERDRKERKLWENHPKNDVAPSVRTLTDSTCRMLDLVNEIESKIPTANDPGNGPTDLLAKLKRERKQARRCRETALDVQWRMLQPETAQHATKSVSDLPAPVRQTAVNLIAQARSLRAVEKQNGAVPKQEMEKEAASIVYQGLRLYNSTLRQQQKKADQGLDPPTDIVLPNDNDEFDKLYR